MLEKKFEQKIQQLQNELVRQQDIEAIRTVAYSYGYYMDNALYSEVKAMFSPNIESCEVAGYGKFVGSEGCSRMWKELFGHYYGGNTDEIAFGRLAKHLLLKDVITINDAGDKAQGRFEYMGVGGTLGHPERTHQQFGIYTFDFYKEDGIWTIGKFWLSFNTINYDHRDWAANPRIRCPRPGVTPDAPSSFHHPFPESGIIPFHYPNPVTGKPIKEYVNPERYWEGNWPGEFGGPCGKRADARDSIDSPRAPSGK